MAKEPRKASGLFDEPPGDEALAVEARGYQPLSEDNKVKGIYPYGGSPVLLTPDGKTFHPAVWRVTRKFDPIAPGWVSTGFWAVRNGGGRKIDFEPIGFRKFEDEPLFARPPKDAA